MPQHLPADFAIDYATLEAKLTAAGTGPDAYQAIVDTPFTATVHMALLGLGITVLLLANKEAGTLDRIALSNTTMAQGSTKYSMKKFEEIKIPIDYQENVLVQVYQSGKSQQVSDWSHMFVPELTPEQARLNQASAGIGTSVIYPLEKGAMIFSYFQEPDAITEAQHGFMQAYTELVNTRL